MNTQLKIATVCDEIKQLLLAKNEKYGDSALNPSRIFSKAGVVEQLLVRIDDKLNRIQKGAGLVASDEDVIQDLIGYLVLLKIAIAEQKQTDLYSEVVKFCSGDLKFSSPNNSYDRNWNHVTDMASGSDPIEYNDLLGQRSPD